MSRADGQKGGGSVQIPGAYPSPRVAAGVLRWYEGDTFEIVLRLELKDQDGEEVTIGASDSVSVTFYNETHETVHTFSLQSIENNCAALDFSSTVTAKFPKGQYTYDIRYAHGDKTTLARDNRAFVE